MDLDVEDISDISWDEDPFGELIFPTDDDKILFQGLVEARYAGMMLDDFVDVRGKD